MGLRPPWPVKSLCRDPSRHPWINVLSLAPTLLLQKFGGGVKHLKLFNHPWELAFAARNRNPSTTSPTVLSASTVLPVDRTVC